MLVRPLPGVDRDDLLETLRRLQMSVSNVRPVGNAEFNDAYNAWTDDAMRSLRDRLSSADLDRLVLTRRYWQMQSMQVYHPNRILLLRTEIEERVADFERAIQALQGEIQRWSRPGVFAVVDTSVCYNADKLEDWDVAQVLGTIGDPVHLLFPMVVIDELDRLKESKDDHIRWRAGSTLATLDRRLANGSVGQLHAAGDIHSEEVTVEIVLDPPGHTRLPIEDDEIVDRALAIQSLAGRDVTLITYDTGQSHRARMVGLKELKLSKPPQPEPEPRSGPKPGRGRRGQQARDPAVKSRPVEHGEEHGRDG